jgi:hypothetical protein
MRTAAWLLVIVAIGAIAQAEPSSGTVVVSCNEADASLIVDGVLLPERTPAVLTLPAGRHVIEARKPPLVADKKVVDVADQQQTKVRFELLPVGPPPAPPPADGSAGSGAAAGSGAGSGSGSGSGSAAPPVVPTVAQRPPAPAQRCTEGGREVACVQGPHCTEGGKLVPCKKGDPLPVTTPPVPPPGQTAVVAAGSGAGSAARVEPPAAGSTAAMLDIATTAPRAIVYVDGAPVREAPCVLEVEPGEHVVGVYAAGMVPAESLVRATAGQRQRVELTPSLPRKRIDVPAQ